MDSSYSLTFSLISFAKNNKKRSLPRAKKLSEFARNLLHLNYGKICASVIIHAGTGEKKIFRKYLLSN